MESHDSESYINFVEDRYLRKNLTMLRLSCHSLYIETGRYKKVPQNLRICENCNLNEIENEYHFTMRCPLYQQSRNEIFTFFDNSKNEQWHKSQTLLEKFKVLTQPCNQKAAIAVCQFIKTCFALRKRKQYN